ncbi:MAG: TIGR03808 family TAT-translocated repetitive protein [Devosia sp.]
MRPNRRHTLAGLAALLLATPARAQAIVPDLNPGSTDDQSGPLQDALLRASAEGRPLFLPPGTYFAQNLQVPSYLVVEGIPGKTMLAAAGEAPVARVVGSAHVRFENVGFSAGHGGPVGIEEGLLEIEASDHVTLTSCGFTGGKASGIVIHDAATEIDACDFLGHGRAAIFSADSRGLVAARNRIAGCGNAGILIRGGTSRRGASTLLGNSISGIGATNGGTGQNGNGISVFRCDDVLIANNRIADCAFTAIRLNATNNVVVSGNLCRNSGDVAILSQFAFTGSVISDNIVDGAALGISVTSMDRGGQLATITGNIVRNIRAASAVNPETRPIGIYAEAETTITGNTVAAVAGTGIRAGTGEFLRNVVIADNVVSAADTGIGVSVAPGAGPVSITDNTVTARAHGIVGLEAETVVSDDLVRDAAQYPQVSLSGNRVGA